MTQKKEPAGGKPAAGKPATGKSAGTASRRRKSLAGDQGSRQLSRPLLIAMLVVVVGGGYLFWPRGGDVLTGIGEQYSVVTADSTHQATPRSGSVDINGQQADLVPEPPEARPTTGGDAERQPEVIADDDPPPARTEPEPVRTTKPPATSKPRTSEPVKLLEPEARGPWAVQLGAYKTRENADQVVERLDQKGIKAHVRAANTSSGEMIHRVWIGWFKSRADAQTFARERRAVLGEAYPVHR